MSKRRPLLPRQLCLPKLAEEFSAIMQQEHVTLAELLQGLAEEREQIWRERQQGLLQTDFPSTEGLTEL